MPLGTSLISSDDVITEAEHEALSISTIPMIPMSSAQAAEELSFDRLSGVDGESVKVIIDTCGERGQETAAPRVTIPASVPSSIPFSFPPSTMAQDLDSPAESEGVISGHLNDFLKQGITISSPSSSCSSSISPSVQHSVAARDVTTEVLEVISKVTVSTVPPPPPPPPKYIPAAAKSSAAAAAAADTATATAATAATAAAAATVTLPDISAVPVMLDSIIQPVVQSVTAPQVSPVFPIPGMPIIQTTGVQPIGLPSQQFQQQLQQQQQQQLLQQQQQLGYQYYQQPLPIPMPQYPLGSIGMSAGPMGLMGTVGMGPSGMMLPGGIMPGVMPGGMSGMSGMAGMSQYIPLGGSLGGLMGGPMGGGPPHYIPPVVGDPNNDVSSWSAHEAEDKRKYWYNRVTGTSTYDKPFCLKTPEERSIPPCKWKEYTAADGKKYYSDGNESRYVVFLFFVYFFLSPSLLPLGLEWQVLSGLTPSRQIR